LEQQQPGVTLTNTGMKKVPMREKPQRNKDLATTADHLPTQT
jgi:hypothetical protein